VKEGKDVEYFDVLSDADKLDTMLKYSDGKRKVPVIIDQGKVTIGFDGRS
jgi:glutaredoxin 3